MRTTRRLHTALLAIGLVPAVLALPVLTAPAPTPHPVKAKMAAIGLSGVDRLAATALRAEAARSFVKSGAYDPSLGAPELLTAKRTAQTFQAIGVTWKPTTGPAAHPTVNVRVHSGGKWSEWETLDVTDISPDNGSAEARSATFRQGSEPLLTDPADGYQVRVDTTNGRLPQDLRVDLVNPGSSAADAALEQDPPASSAEASASQPPIITRAQWGADESIRRGSPTYMPTIVAGFVHHTATTNSYTTTTAAAQIRSIYAYHVEGNGWSDIGYNFLIDKFGRIYEGRYGGISRAVQGAHTGGFNYDTFGVSALGNYQTAAAPTAMVNAYARLFAWKLDLYHRDPLGKVTLTSQGGGTSRYAAGTRVTVNVISGHRDVGYTECPGNYLYAKLPTIRSMVKSLMGSVLYSPAQSTSLVNWGGTGPAVTFRPSRSMAWRLDVRDSCSGTVVRTYTGTSATAVSVRWDLKTANGTWANPGAYSLSLTSSGARSWSGTVEVAPTVGSPLSTCVVQRESGGDLYGTSVVAARTAAPDAKTVVLVSGDPAHLVDGLVAAPLAKTTGGVLLMTTAGKLPATVRAEIIRRHATTAYLVGGTSVITTPVQSELQSIGVTKVVRAGGSDRYGTAAAVAKLMPTHATTAVVASGDNLHLVDALAAGGPAAATDQPVLLTAPTSLPAVTKDTLTQLGITSTVVVGGTQAVSDTVKAQLPSPVRVAGADRFSTATAIATYYSSRVPVAKIAVAPGAGTAMAYALVASGLGRLTVLTNPTSVPAVTLSWIKARPAVASAALVGAPTSVSTGVLLALAPAVAA